MFDARHVYRKMMRKIYDFSPEQLANLTVIVWALPGRPDHVSRLISEYFTSTCAEAEKVETP